MEKPKPSSPDFKSGFITAQRRHYEETRVLGIIHRFTALLPQKLKVEEVCNHLVRVIIEETEFENCSIVLWNAQHEFLSLAAAFGMDDMLGESAGVPYHRGLRFNSREEIALRAFHTKAAYFIEDTAKEPIPTKPDAVVRPGALVCLPLLDIGVMNLSRTTPRSIPQVERNNWLLLSNIVGHIILDAFLHQNLTDNNEQLQYAVDEKSKALELKSHQLMAANSFLELVIDDAPQGICLLDADGGITRTNKALQKLQRDQGLDLLGRRPAMFFHRPAVYEDLCQRLRLTGEARALDVTMVRTGGERYAANAFLNRLQDNSGTTLGYLLILEDITESKAIAEKLMRAEKLSALGTMAGGVAHDFNNLLTTIMGNTQLLLHQNQSEETNQRLQNIEMAVRDGAHTVRRLQSFTRLDLDRLSSPAVVDVTDIILDAIELTRPRWKNSMEKFGCTIELCRELQPECWVSIHASDLREVLTNLIFNAIDAMPQGGTLTLGSERQEGWVILEVIDSGLGMDEEVQRKVFDPFYTTKGVTNSGLGLSVSYSLVRRYGGEISLESRVGMGSRFRIQLPAAVHCALPVHSQEAIILSSPRKLLVVDDEEDILSLIQDMLLMAGHQVTVAHDGQKAMELIEQGDFDMVFTDLGMPSINGWNIARKVKDIKPEIPVVLVTGWGAQYEGQDLSSQGIDLVLPKPVSYKQLVSAIKTCLSESADLH
jgi:PAS domain S-box-containing protein